MKHYRYRGALYRAASSFFDYYDAYADLDQVELGIDYENYSEEWWGSGGEALWSGLAGGDEDVIVSRATAEQWIQEAEQIPGWDDGHDFARFPITIRDPQSY